MAQDEVPNREHCAIESLCDIHVHYYNALVLFGRKIVKEALRLKYRLRKGNDCSLFPVSYMTLFAKDTGLEKKKREEKGKIGGNPKLVGNSRHREGRMAVATAGSVGGSKRRTRVGKAEAWLLRVGVVGT